MRYADRITFVKATDERYDPDLGEYTTGETTQKVLPCFVMDLGMAESVQIFGDYQKDRKVIYLKQPYTKTFDYCEYKGKRYKAQANKLGAVVFYLEGDDSIGS
ncbi:hypothetical protein K3M97_08850 [Streptococcus dysgalactiae subsp. dysgalactiae]|uniref:hypothetical protein n=1 Tax=Streptococcus dysgalactiae TaxID=1334 RepID=UPI001CF57C18|nr:hypothetical protein [Streptococcus dysgalactiae]MCB2835986.1 hypothetical protein [Streptococcus dysgalactiae subsp. dysgalactiae]